MEYIEHGAPIDEWLAKFRGLTLKNIETIDGEAILDFGNLGILIHSHEPPTENAKTMQNTKLLSWENRPIGVVLHFDNHRALVIRASFQEVIKKDTPR